MPKHVRFHDDTPIEETHTSKVTYRKPWRQRKIDKGEGQQSERIVSLLPTDHQEEDKRQHKKKKAKKQTPGPLEVAQEDVPDIEKQKDLPTESPKKKKAYKIDCGEQSVQQHRKQQQKHQERETALESWDDTIVLQGPTESIIVTGAPEKKKKKRKNRIDDGDHGGQHQQNKIQHTRFRDDTPIEDTHTSKVAQEDVPDTEKQKVLPTESPKKKKAYKIDCGEQSVQQHRKRQQKQQERETALESWDDTIVLQGPTESIIVTGAPEKKKKKRKNRIDDGDHGGQHQQNKIQHTRFRDDTPIEDTHTSKVTYRKPRRHITIENEERQQSERTVSLSPTEHQEEDEREYKKKKAKKQKQEPIEAKYRKPRRRIQIKKEERQFSEYTVSPQPTEHQVEDETQHKKKVKKQMQGPIEVTQEDVPVTKKQKELPIESPKKKKKNMAKYKIDCGQHRKQQQQQHQDRETAKESVDDTMNHQEPTELSQLMGAPEKKKQKRKNRIDTGNHGGQQHRIKMQQKQHQEEETAEEYEDLSMDDKELTKLTITEAPEKKRNKNKNKRGVLVNTDRNPSAPPTDHFRLPDTRTSTPWTITALPAPAEVTPTTLPTSSHQSSPENTSRSTPIVLLTSSRQSSPDNTSRSTPTKLPTSSRKSTPNNTARSTPTKLPTSSPMSTPNNTARSTPTKLPTSSLQSPPGNTVLSTPNTLPTSSHQSSPNNTAPSTPTKLPTSSHQSPPGNSAWSTPSTLPTDTRQSPPGNTVPSIPTMLPISSHQSSPENTAQSTHTALPTSSRQLSPDNTCQSTPTAPPANSRKRVQLTYGIIPDPVQLPIRPSKGLFADCVVVPETESEGEGQPSKTRLSSLNKEMGKRPFFERDLDNLFGSTDTGQDKTYKPVDDEESSSDEGSSSDGLSKKGMVITSRGISLSRQSRRPTSSRKSTPNNTARSTPTKLPTSSHQSPPGSTVLLTPNTLPTSSHQSSPNNTAPSTPTKLPTSSHQSPPGNTVWSTPSMLPTGTRQSPPGNTIPSIPTTLPTSSHQTSPENTAQSTPTALPTSFRQLSQDNTCGSTPTTSPANSRNRVQLPYDIIPDPVREPIRPSKGPFADGEVASETESKGESQPSKNRLTSLNKERGKRRLFEGDLENLFGSDDTDQDKTYKPVDDEESSSDEGSSNDGLSKKDMFIKSRRISLSRQSRRPTSSRKSTPNNTARSTPTKLPTSSHQSPPGSTVLLTPNTLPTSSHQSSPNNTAPSTPTKLPTSSHQSPPGNTVWSTPSTLPTGTRQSPPGNTIPSIPTTLPTSSHHTSPENTAQSTPTALPTSFRQLSQDNTCGSTPTTSPANSRNRVQLPYDIIPDPVREPIRPSKGPFADGEVASETESKGESQPSKNRLTSLNKERGKRRLFEGDLENLFGSDDTDQDKTYKPVDDEESSSDEGSSNDGLSKKDMFIKSRRISLSRQSRIRRGVGRDKLTTSSILAEGPTVSGALKPCPYCGKRRRSHLLKHLLSMHKKKVNNSDTAKAIQQRLTQLFTKHGISRYPESYIREKFGIIAHEHWKRLLIGLDRCSIQVIPEGSTVEEITADQMQTYITSDMSSDESIVEDEAV